MYETAVANPNWITLFWHPEVIVFMIPIVAIVVSGVVVIVKNLIRHRERMAMIERGMNPDYPSSPRDVHDRP